MKTLKIVTLIMLGLGFIYFAGFVMFMALIGEVLAKTALVLAIATAWAFYQIFTSMKNQPKIG